MPRLMVQLGLAVLPLSALAQTRVTALGGVVLTSRLLRDSIVQPLTLRPGPAAAAGLALRTRLDSTYQLGLELTVSRATLTWRSPGETGRLGALTTWTPAITLVRRLGGSFGIRVAVGAAIYRPARREGTLFHSGAPIVPLAGLAFTTERVVARSWVVAADLGYDAHRFTTTALREQGFGGEQLVHRVAAFLSVSRAWR